MCDVRRLGIGFGQKRALACPEAMVSWVEYHQVMIAAGIFLCLFLLLLSTLRRRGWVTTILFVLTLVLIALLFLHHATESLPINV
mgnify:CR=1 FL=1